ncbi:MAG TPA: peptidoglycan-binding domain-containing protein [Candidatus Acidoferrum sp.]|nr:peptidoglycan-binding domain-containing protein [Candidatus Acidoferrum sp.]
MSTSYPADAENKSINEIAPAVQFKQNRRIQGSDRWVGSNYEVFRNYRSEWHDRDWWRSHYSRIVFGVGGWYYWNAGYWFPAWGYDPGAHYAYDGPICAFNDLPPDQVVANVQSTLQPQGYYQAEADGLLGPRTRAAIVNYQRDHSLYTTTTIDGPTLQSLGMR